MTKITLDQEQHLGSDNLIELIQLLHLYLSADVVGDKDDDPRHKSNSWGGQSQTNTTPTLVSESIMSDSFALVSTPYPCTSFLLIVLVPVSY